MQARINNIDADKELISTYEKTLEKFVGRHMSFLWKMLFCLFSSYLIFTEIYQKRRLMYIFRSWDVPDMPKNFSCVLKGVSNCVTDADQTGKGAYINYVGKILPNLTPSLLRRQVYYISLWLTPSSHACLRSLWMPPKMEVRTYK